MNQDVKTFLEKYICDLETGDFQFYGFEVSYVDTLTGRVTTYSFSTKEYSEITFKGVENEIPGSLLRSNQLHYQNPESFPILQPVTNPSVSRSTSNKETARTFYHVPITAKTEVSPSQWAEYYSNSGFGGFFYVNAHIDTIIGYQLTQFSLFQTTLEEDQIQRQLKGFDIDAMLKIIFSDFRSTIADLNLQATRAAISQVMARNMSHNIGSHVMNRFTKVDDIYELIMFKNGNIKSLGTFRDSNNKNDLYSDRFEFYVPRAYRPKTLKTGSLDFNSFNLVATFNAYLKYRMGYLGDVTFGAPMMQTSKKISELHRDFERNLLLLDSISGLGENFPYAVDFTVHNSPVCDESGPTGSDHEIAVPNDVLGCQAFYNIIENVIRNTAKYSNFTTDPSSPEEQAKQTNPVVNFTVDFSDAKVCGDYKSEIDDPHSLYCVEIWDDVDLNEKPIIEFSDTEYQEYFEGAGESAKEKTKMSFTDVLVFRQNRQVNESVLDQKTMQLRTKGLGLLEMEASAAYLRRLPDITDIESDSYKVLYNDHHFTTSQEIDQDGKHKDVTRLNILKAFVKHDSDKKYLGYRFYVLKPKIAVVVSENEVACASELRKQGIVILNIKQFNERLKKNLPLNHEFLVYDQRPENNTELSKLFEEHKTSLPLRKICTDINDLIGNGFVIDRLKADLWRLWFEELKHRKPGVNTVEDVSFQSGDNPTNNSGVEDHFVIQFLSHASAFSKNDFNSNYYLEPLSSFGQEKLPNYKVNHIRDYPESISSDIESRIRLFEAATTRVIVIDERIQNYAKDKSEGVKNREIFESIGVRVPPDKENDPDSGFDLDSRDYGSTWKKVKRFVESSLPPDDTDEISKPFMILHYGILERSYKGSGSDWVSDVEAQLKSWGKRANIVITSGRGKPKELPGNVRFVHLSSVLNVFTEVRSKYLMTNLLYSARRAS